MKQMDICTIAIATNDAGPTSLRVLRHISWRTRVSAVCYAMIGTLLLAERVAAQNDEPQGVLFPSTIRGVSNPQAGEYPLFLTPDYLVTVPPQCAGKKRCPLVVLLLEDSSGARAVTDSLRSVVDRYGMILLTTSGFQTRALYAAIQEVWQKFAIDRSRVAIFGSGASGAQAMRFGIHNIDAFNRIGSLSGGISIDGITAPAVATAARGGQTEFFVSEGVREHGNFSWFRYYWQLDQIRKAGFHVQQMISFREREPQVDDYEFLWRWLQESWSKSPPSRVAPDVVVNNDSAPVLTVEILNRMTAFWTSFMREPDSIRIVARRANLRDVYGPLHALWGNSAKGVDVVMTDMPALAAKYPSVAADLKRAGLTVQQHEAYRMALLIARLLEPAWHTPNGEFIENHQDEFLALWATGMWHTP